jgi:hypothetical protein
MLLFSGLHMYSDDVNYGPMTYWLVMAAISAFIAYGRFVLKPFQQTAENIIPATPNGKGIKTKGCAGEK